MTKKSITSLKCLCIGDSLAMPVHWFYDPKSIKEEFGKNGIEKLEDAPKKHPYTFMKVEPKKGNEKQLVGDVILKGKEKLWTGKPERIHVHHGLKAGENTLNLHCARIVLRHLAEGSDYDGKKFLQEYIKFMTADTPQHPDTYAEGYHRQFFENYAKGVDVTKCSVKSGGTASMGGLVTVAPLAIVLLTRALKNGKGVIGKEQLKKIQDICNQHIWYTHPDTKLTKVASFLVELYALLLTSDKPVKKIIAEIALKSLGKKYVEDVLEKSSDLDDFKVVAMGGMYKSSCAIEFSWPTLLYFSYKYSDDPIKGLLQNTNVGGENVHRGAVLGSVLGLAQKDDSSIEPLFSKLLDKKDLLSEIKNAL